MRDYAELKGTLKECCHNWSCDTCRMRQECADNGCVVEKAADAIEELLAAVPKWISVDERLPDDFSRVLGFMAWGGMMLLERQSKGWYLADRIQQAPDEAVLYWMTLPEPPKEGTE